MGADHRQDGGRERIDVSAEQLLVLGVVVVGVATLAHRIERLPVTLPMIALAAGLVLGPDVTGLLTLAPGDEGTLLLAEVTLATLLFTDASRIDLASLREGIALPARLLGVGLPLTVLGGVAVAMVLLGLDAAGALVIAAILAPTDAALGQAVVTDERLPVAIRQGLNVEAGLNDGLVLPVLTLGLALVGGGGLPGLDGALLPVPGGLLLGAVVGAGVTSLLGAVRRAGGIDAAWEQLAVLAALATTFGLAEVLGANAFLAAFTAGLALRAVAGDDAGRLTAYSEDTAQLLAVVAVLLFGAVFVPEALAATTTAVVACAVLVLVLVRPAAVWLSLTGTGLLAPTRLFIGWFGPRGLASILLGTLVLIQLDDSGAPAGTVAVVGWTVVLSIVLHGMSAAPLAARYADWFRSGQMHDSPEAMPTSRPVLRWQRDG